MANYTVSYAQNREDIILSGFFKGLEKGFYVDVGANHPDTLSVTKIFYDKGWSGINLEPNKELYKLIVQQRPRDINLNIGAADKPGELTLREYPQGDGLSTFSKEAQEQYEKSSSAYSRYTREHKDYTVKVQTLSDIFKEQNVGTINFMNIDVEGFEYQVIKGNDWSKYRPQVICIEANHIVKDWRPLLKAANYELVFFDGLNNYYVAKENQEIADNFSYVETLLLTKPVIPASANNEIEIIKRHYRELEEKIIRQELIEQDLREVIHNLYVERDANNRLRAIVRRLFGSIHRIILLQIEKLNKPKVKRQSALNLIDDKTPEALLRQLREYDVNTYYGSKTTEPLTYRIVFTIYTAFYKTLKAAAMSLVRILRKVKT